jgi:hypothetical protein
MDRRVVISQIVMVLRTFEIQVQIGSNKKLSGGIQILEDVRVLRVRARRGLERLEDPQRHQSALGGDNVSVAARKATEAAEGGRRLRPVLCCC